MAGLTEIGRTRVAEFLPVSPYRFGYPNVTALDGDFYVAALLVEDIRLIDDVAAAVWYGVTLFAPDKVHTISVHLGNDWIHPDTMWLFPEGGALVVAALTFNIPDGDPWVPQGDWVLELMRLDPASGALLGRSAFPTGIVASGPDVTHLYSQLNVCEQVGGQMSLRAYGWRNNAAVVVEAIGSGESWTVTVTPDPVASGDRGMNRPVTAHGWTLATDWESYGHPTRSWVSLDGGATRVNIPMPTGYGQQSVAYYHAEPGGIAPILAIGWNEAWEGEQPGWAYDLCLYADDSYVPPSTPTGTGGWSGYYSGGAGTDWDPSWGSGTIPDAIIPRLPGDGTIVIINPADPENPWAWGTLPPGSGLNDWMQFYVDKDWVQIHYGGRVVLVWKMPPAVYQRFVESGSSMGFYNPITGVWSPNPPPGVPGAVQHPGLTGYSYLVDSRHWVGESGGGVFGHGYRIDADDVLVFSDRAVIGQALQDDVITSAPIKYLAGRVGLDPVVLSRYQAQLVWDAGYGHYLYPVEVPA